MFWFRWRSLWIIRWLLWRREKLNAKEEVSPGDQGGPFAKPPQAIAEATRLAGHSVRQRAQAAGAWPYMTSKPNRAIRCGVLSTRRPATASGAEHSTLAPAHGWHMVRRSPVISKSCNGKVTLITRKNSRPGWPSFGEHFIHHPERTQDWIKLGGKVRGCEPHQDSSSRFVQHTSRHLSQLLLRPLEVAAVSRCNIG
jgi:hypothetical protein